MSDPRNIRGRVDREGRLIEAGPRLADLHRAAGGDDGGALAVPQIAALARLAQRLGITISRSAWAAEGEVDIDLWVRAEPDASGVSLEISGWTPRPALPPSVGGPERESDFLRAASDWVWECDAALKIVSLSPAAASAAGKAPATLIGLPLTRLFSLVESGEGDMPLIDALAAQRRFDDQLAVLRGGSGGRYRLGGVPMIDGQGRFAGFRGSAAGMTSVLHAYSPAEPSPEVVGGAFGRKLEEALRAPLAHIIANAEIISAQPEGPLRADYAGYAGDIASAGRHLLAMVDDLVDLQEIEDPGFAPVAEPIDLADIARLASGLLGVQASRAEVRVDAPGPDECQPALGAFKRGLQIVVNLLANAIRYTPAGGQVWMRTESEGDLAVLIVADQGKGVAREDHARIFEKFERVDPAEPGGTGLGLYIARRLARSMGGDIALDSAPGQGARFTLTLPKI